jgi:hypothetical protein
MTFIYVDESGDLGMGEKGSKFFIICATKIEDESTLSTFRKIPKIIRQRKLKKSFKEKTELKFYDSSPLIREQFLSRSSKCNIEIYALIIEKKLTNQSLQHNLPILYNYLIKILLEKIVPSVNRKEKLTIYLDRCMSQSQQVNFENYVKTEFLHLFSDLPDLEILHENSLNNPGLQVHDFIVGAFGYKYNTRERRDDAERYVQIIASKIQLERNDFFK